MSELSVNAVAACCRELSTHLPTQVFYPGNGAFRDMQRDYWSRQEASLSPTCIVAPGSARDVSSAVTVLTKDSRCHFAIKGGGHSPNAGYANIHHGITIDMTPMHSVDLNADHSVAHIGSGARWGDVYEYLDSVGGLAVAGGENGDVGVGGLLLGGGISQFGPRVGWSCDNLVNAEIVLASGQIVDANETSHPDLWTALKGGTSNFGIVTRYDLATFAQDRLWSRTTKHHISLRRRAFEVLSSITNSSSYDPYAFPATELVFSSGAWSVENVLYYTKPVDTTPGIYKPFIDIPSQGKSQAKVSNLSSLANENSVQPVMNVALSTGTYGVDVDLLNDIFAINNRTLQGILPRVNGSVLWSLTYQPLPSVWLGHASKKGGNSLGVSPEQGNAHVVFLTVKWTDNRASDLVQKAVSRMQDQVDEYARSRDLKRDLVYLNYAGKTQDPLSSYGKRKLQELKEVAKTYDPRGVFQTQVPGGYKLKAL
ncbi:FAD binding domain protein [Penicillium capsulatum]|uniref:FAD binding domain protein n=1 Tax=Penicillium capsulatum TaxID=69766 RepID=A0A9W9LLY2_9EURO|nr:FAD binding domain protein [Penicillium capsulatum]KAJ6117558.1 FAD binding domain protein [Penicillium capsulatum]